jgi:hypothetical protein
VDNDETTKANENNRNFQQRKSKQRSYKANSNSTTKKYHNQMTTPLEKLNRDDRRKNW